MPIIMGIIGSIGITVLLGTGSYVLLSDFLGEGGTDNVLAKENTKREQMISRVCVCVCVCVCVRACVRAC